MEYHPAANVFPLMQGAEYRALCDDITEHGLHEDILVYEGSILDGRNRHRACIDAGIEPRFREWDGNGSALDMVVSMNLHRRHLNPGQLGMCAAEGEWMLAGEAKERQRGGQGGALLGANLPQAKGRALEHAAAIFGVSRRTAQEAKKLKAEAPDLAEKVRAGEVTISEAKKENRSRKTNIERAALAATVEVLPKNERFALVHDDIRHANLKGTFDTIITDPPYPREYVPLYEILAERATEWLRPDGLLVVMCGQLYADEIMARMSKHLNYYWTGCYLTPGPAPAIRTRQVNTNWKPLFIFSRNEYKGKLFGDVFRSERRDKDHHAWGQSVSGFSAIIGGICVPGQHILDPFCGAGTTGIAAVQNGCRFTGIDIDNEALKVAAARLKSL